MECPSNPYIIKKSVIEAFPSIIMTSFSVLFSIVLFGICNALDLFSYFSFNSSTIGTAISLQITASFLSITLFEIITHNINSRIVGISFIRIFFGDALFLLNAGQIMQQTLIFLFTSLIAGFVMCGNNSIIIVRIGKLIVLSNQFFTLFLLYRLLFLALIAKFKASRLYYVVFNRLKKHCVLYSRHYSLCSLHNIVKKTNDDKVQIIYAKMIGCLDTYKNDGEHNKYLFESMELFLFLRLNLCYFECDEKRIPTLENKIDAFLFKMVDSDSRSNISIRKRLLNRYKNDNKYTATINSIFAKYDVDTTTKDAMPDDFLLNLSNIDTSSNKLNWV